MVSFVLGQISEEGNGVELCSQRSLAIFAQSAQNLSGADFVIIADHRGTVLAATDPAARFAVMRDTDTLMIWQSMLRGVGIYGGCTRCYDVCPVGDDYETHLQEVQATIPEETAAKRDRLAALARERATGRARLGLGQHRRWIGLESDSL